MLYGALQTLKAEQINNDVKLTVTTFVFGETIAVGAGELTINYSGLINDKVHFRYHVSGIDPNMSGVSIVFIDCSFFVFDRATFACSLVQAQ